MHDKRARYVEHEDGDSVTMMLDQDFWDTKTINIRLANTWAPEMSEAGGDDVRLFIYHWFIRHITAAADKTTWPFLVVTHETRTGKKKVSFNRFIADVMTIDGKNHLNSDVMKYIAERGFTGGIGSISR